MTCTGTDNFLDLTSTKQKRTKLIEAFKLFSSHESINLEQQFEDYVLNVNLAGFDDEALLDVTLRYGILYLEEIDYQKKIHALKILNHLMDNVTHAKLLFNMRAQLLYDTYNKYLNDKECVQFLRIIGQSMLKLLEIMEPNYSSGDHYYSKHSQTLASMLSNCYMSTSLAAKTVYYRNLTLFIHQMGVFACRHLEKCLTIAFDSIESCKIGLDFEKQSELVDSGIDFTIAIVDTCSKRIHCHARLILNNCIKMLYFYSLYATEMKESVVPDKQKSNVIDKVCRVVEKILINDKTPKIIIEEFKNLKNDHYLNNNFKILVESI